MKVHIFKDENVYVLSLLEFLARNFDLSGHRFIFRTKSSGIKLPVDESNVNFLPGNKGLLKIVKIVKESDKVFFHLLPTGVDLIFWYLNRQVFNKSTWIFWGADVYTYRSRYKNPKHLIYHYMRKRIIPMIPEIGGFLRGDFELIKNVYHSKATYTRVFYPIPTNFELCDKIQQGTIRETGRKISILLGNSGNETNHHIEAINILGRYKNENLQVLCPLSYGARGKSYVAEVIKKGHAVFGNNFTPILKFISPGDYLLLLNEIDVAVMNHSRQQGMSSSLTLLYLGKKVFVNAEAVSYKYLTDNKVAVYRVSDILNLSFQEFISFDNSKGILNKEILREEFAEKNFIKHWKQILQ